MRGHWLRGVRFYRRERISGLLLHWEPSGFASAVEGYEDRWVKTPIYSFRRRGGEAA